MEYYDFRSKTWNTLCDVNNWRSCTSMVRFFFLRFKIAALLTFIKIYTCIFFQVSHGTCIFFLGGEESDKDSPTGSRTVNRVTRYDCEQKSWISVPSMQLARRWAASIVIDNKIYVIGKLYSSTGCLIWIKAKVNQYQGHVFSCSFTLHTYYLSVYVAILKLPWMKSARS